MNENKFSIILGAITAVIVGVLLWFGFTKSKEYTAAKEEFDVAQAEIQRMTGGDIFPSQENRQAKEAAVAAYAKEVADLQEAFAPFRVVELPQVSVAQFTDDLLAKRREVVEQFRTAGTEFPEEFFLGLRKYTDRPVENRYAAQMHYQLQAFSQLFRMLAESKPIELENVHRPELPEENGEAANLEGRTYRAHPIEITFRASEQSLRDFLVRLDHAEDFYYVVRALSVRNERGTAPNAQDARFEAASTGFGSAFDNLAFDDAAASDNEQVLIGDGADAAADVAPAATDTGEILKQVLGSETIRVFMRIDVLQFLEPKPLPKS